MEGISHIVEIEMEDGSIAEAEVLGGFEMEGEKYVALVVEAEEEDERDVLIYRYFEEDGNAGIESIDDEEEYNAAADLLEVLMDEWLESED